MPLLAGGAGSTSAHSMLAMAASQIGQTPDSNGATKYTAWYASAYNAPQVVNGDWCDAFISWCAAQAKQGDVVGASAWVPTHVDFFKARGQFGQTPRVGAIVFMDFVIGVGGDGSHVGIVETVNGDGTVGTIEGNTSAGGHPSICTRRTRSLDIIGYGYPAYHSTPDPAVVDDDVWLVM
jgi:surface antigen